MNSITGWHKLAGDVRENKLEKGWIFVYTTVNNLRRTGHTQRVPERLTEMLTKEQIDL